MDLFNQTLTPKRPGKYKAPNIKSLFLSEPDYVFFDADLEQADAQVVAWEADDDILKEIFRDPYLDLHTENAKMIFGSCPTKDHPNRKKAKAGVHAVNYHVFPRTLAKTLGITVHEAELFIRRWFDIHPNIKEWHNRIYNQMMSEKCIRNAFGFQKNYFDARDNHTALSEALAWIPQSTVGNIINIVWQRVNDKWPPVVEFPDVFVSLQVHDSLVSQVLRQIVPQTALDFKELFQVVVPYEDPLIIGSSLDVGLNAGELCSVSWDGFIKDPSTGEVTDEIHEFWLPMAA